MTEHKIGTVYVPKDKSQYGFSGPGADAAAVDINASIKMTIRAIQAHDAKQWEALAMDLMRHYKVDKDPFKSRRAVSSALAGLYKDMMLRIEEYMDTVPTDV